MNTLLHCLDAWANESPSAPAQAWKKDGVHWSTITASELRERVTHLANYLSSLGVGKNDIGLIYSYNSPSWVQMDLALMLVGASSAGLYINSSQNQIAYILEHSQAKVLLVESLGPLRKVFRTPSPFLKKIIVVNAEGELPENAISLEAAVAAGAKGTRRFADYLPAIRPESQATLIYTSGTTGQPKAVALSHANLTFAAASYRTTWDPPKQGQLISFLPLAHIAERIASTGIGLTNRYVVYFCSSPMTIASELKEVQPTILLCVPRLWDKLKEGTENRVARLRSRQRRIFEWATSVSRVYQALLLAKQHVPLRLRLARSLAERLVLKKLRHQLGLSNARRTVSGAAKLSSATLEWYRGIGVRLIEGYALSETSGVLTCGIGTEETAHTVGIPYQGIQLRLAEDGEIETSGPHVFLGYFRDEAATAAILKDGWLRTGDIGEIDERGFLHILGRKREIIKTAEGKMVSPLFLESRISACPWVDQAVVIGNERPHLVALITLPEERRREAAAEKQIRAHIDSLNRELASHERIKAFRVLDRSFSIENDEMTATLKLKRSVIEQHFHPLIDSMYERELS